MKKILLVAAGSLLIVGLLLSCTSKNLEEQKERAEASRNLGEAYLREGKYAVALQALLKAEAMTPDDYFLQNDIGLVYYYRGKQDLAIQHFKKALALKEDYAPARNNLGNAYAEKKEWDKAIEQYKRVSTDLLYATPQFPLSNLGVAYYEKKEYQLSEQYFLKALQAKQDFDRALYGLGRTYMAMGRVQEAISKLERASEVAPDAAPVHYELARAYTKNREYKKAYNSYLKVVKLDPGSPLADKSMKEAQKLKYLF
ncbi:MAG: tetratricopeptide repeat protein [Desulfobacterales bacterium]